MTFDNSILTIVTFLPLVGALLLLFFPGRDEAAANVQRWVALVTTLATFVLTLFVWARFDPSNPGFQMVVNIPWIGDSIGYRMGVDGISVLFVPLTGLLMPMCILASWNSVHSRIREYLIVFLVL
ncbi:MAG: NADH-quinone oxidoreductase subunit M, partial [Devosia nanyangense]|nr:NADH-quinone oxidoreductase subunit M [Devosia nanyangense]